MLWIAEKYLRNLHVKYLQCVCSKLLCLFDKYFLPELNLGLFPVPKKGSWLVSKSFPDFQSDFHDLKKINKYLL